MRNDFEKRGAEQRADCEGHQHRYPRGAQREREGGEAGGKRTAGDARDQNPGKRHGGVDSSQMAAAMRAAVRSRRKEKKRSRSEYVQKSPPLTSFNPFSLARATA